MKDKKNKIQLVINTSSAITMSWNYILTSSHLTHNNNRVIYFVSHFLRNLLVITYSTIRTPTLTLNYLFIIFFYFLFLDMAQNML